MLDELEKVEDEALVVTMKSFSLLQAGRIPADNQVGRYLMDLVAKVPKLQPEDLDQMLNNSMKVMHSCEFNGEGERGR